MKKAKVIISCGGTGGHIFPGLEIAKSLQQKDSNLDILFVGALGRMEMHQIPKAGFLIKGIWIQGIYRKSILKNIFFPLKLIISLIQSFFILLYHSPIAVIGTGGFASFPILYTATFLGIKTYIQEQNCYAGLANRLLGKYVKRVFVAHDNMENFFPKNKILNFGNPVRKSLKINSVSKKESREFFGLKEDVFTVLVVGGSLGAPAINHALSTYFDFNGYMLDLYPVLYKMYKEWEDSAPGLREQGFQLIWQTGEKDYEQVSQKIGYPPIDETFELPEEKHKLNYGSNTNIKVAMFPFIDRMDLAYHSADIVVSRAGAIAIAEICFLSKASILIPSPYVTDDHQKKNAEYLAKKNASIMIDNNGPVYTKDLITKIYSFVKNPDLIPQIGRNANNLFKYNSADDIVRVVLKDIQN